MNNTITADMLRLNTNISLMESLTIIFLYVFFAIYISRWSYKQSKKYNLVSLESFRFTKEKANMLQRSDEIGDLEQVVSYCYKLGEKIKYTDKSVNIFI